MPRSRTYRRRYRPARRSRAGLRRMKVYQSPNTSFRKMSYDAIKFVSPGVNSGFVPNYHFAIRANSIWDPDNSQGGESAVGYNSAALSFNHYTVYACRATVHWTPYSQSATSYVIGGGNEGCGVPIWVGIGLVPDMTQVTQDYKHLSQDHNWSWDLINLQNASWSGEKDGRKQYIQTKWFSAKTFFNCSSPKDVESISSAMGTNPVDQAYFAVAAVATRTKLFTPEGSDFGTWCVHYHLEYWVDLQEPKFQGVAE